MKPNAEEGGKIIINSVKNKLINYFLNVVSYVIKDVFSNKYLLLTLS